VAVQSVPLDFIANFNVINISRKTFRTTLEKNGIKKGASPMVAGVALDTTGCQLEQPLRHINIGGFLLLSPDSGERAPSRAPISPELLSLPLANGQSNKFNILAG
jgi:hypothetical protein